MMSWDQLEVIMSIISIWSYPHELNVIKNMNVIDIDHAIMKDQDLENDIGTGDLIDQASSPADFWFLEQIQIERREKNLP